MFNTRKRLRTLESTAATLIETNDKLRSKTAVLQVENRRLRARLAKRVERKPGAVRKPKLDRMRIARRAHVDAGILVAAHVGGLSTSRRESRALGLTDRRWNWACALLDLAHVRNRRGQWARTAPAQMNARLDIALARVEAQGFATLMARASKYGYSGRVKVAA